MTDIGRIRDTLTFLATTSTHGNGRKRAQEVQDEVTILGTEITGRDAVIAARDDTIRLLRAQIDDRDAAISVASRIANDAIAAQASVKNVTISTLADGAERLMDSNVDPRPLSQRDRWRLTAQWLRKHLEDR